MFVVFEGIDYCGKSTIMKLVAEKLRGQGYSVVTTREPGGSKLGEELRNVILTSDKGSIDSVSEALLFISARRQHLVEKIIPALCQDNIVLCDRYTPSSLVYQGLVGGVENTYEMHKLAIGDWFFPELIIHVDSDKSDIISRVVERGVENRFDEDIATKVDSMRSKYDFALKTFNGVVKFKNENGYLSDVVNSIAKTILSRYNSKNVYLNKYELNLSGGKSYYVEDCSRRVKEVNGFYFKADFKTFGYCDLYLTDIENGKSTYICGICDKKVFDSRSEAKNLLKDIYNSDIK